MNFVRYQGWPVRPGQLELGRVLDRFAQAGQSAADGSVGWVPRVDVKEEANRFVIFADLPGVDLDAIEVQMDKNVLSIRGERAAPEAGEEARFTRQERRHGAFARSFTLPETADAEGIVATARNGVLEVVIPKRPEAAPRRIQVGSIQ
ncbi:MULTISPECIES: Hsp20/alpha crystallin family protein [Pseudoxanthomonas]|jgi:HSP20 family protein|uniref:Hsp20/alpha crystallin family protein n=1 Tax=Pseudoxanthomonas winnipegensis TaxID=2480810 RepID=A0A4Q8L7D4_9GAMM|nr:MULTISPECIES: Hsp20/alpha crystallin family protein [Pseudoxanthomonas]TAA23885.1 Hsp20/alpha crystallin family protein [Pseudoxanthomonas winnipegensis]TMN18597.1 Hsp20/alpha crystallin family protein [Pseudoxanthomonas sp. X-1]UAY76657.1 Hsp20/alpha crystallin family protein [Pseudoxanthomonas sp. X-1]